MRAHSWIRLALGTLPVFGCSGPSEHPTPSGDAHGGNGAAGTLVTAATGGTGAAMPAGGAAAVSGRGGSSAGDSTGGRADGVGGGAAEGGGNSAGQATGAGGTLAGSGGTRAGAGGSAGKATGGHGGGSGTGGRTTGGTAGTGGAGGTAGQPASGPVGTFSGPLATGINFLDDKGDRVNAHGGGVIQVGDTYYLHGEYFLSTTTDNDFNGFSMYSSKDLATWKFEKMILPQQAGGELGPKRKGERPHIIKCPSTGEFVLLAHAASEDYQMDREVVYATSSTVNGDYTYVGPLTNSAGTKAEHSDMSALTDGDSAYVVTESGHVYTLASDCHSWTSDKSYSAVNGDSGGSESPTVFKAGNTYYWIGSYKTGWRANNNFYSTAPAMTGPWTYQGYVAPVVDPTDDISDQRTWLSQSTWVIPVVGAGGTTYVYWGDHWDGNQDTSAPGKHNNLATYVFQPLVFTGTAIGLPKYLDGWKLDVGAGTWSPP
jgi:hypothetical protein